MVTSKKAYISMCIKLYTKRMKHPKIIKIIKMLRTKMKQKIRMMKKLIHWIVSTYDIMFPDDLMIFALNVI